MESKNSEEKFIQIMKELCLNSAEKGFTLPDFDIEKCIYEILKLIFFF